MKFYSLKTCDTCRKALKQLTDSGRNVSVIDVRADGVSRADLERFWAAFGEELINRRSTTWRSLSDADKEGDPLDLLLAHPMLMKRPVIDNGQLYLGWSNDVERALI